MTNIAGKLNFIYRTLRGARRDRESFELLFSQFRQVLDDNNKALEIITDMGDTLGGDYLFDIQYVRRSYADLHAAVGDSLRDFDVLTHSRYPPLRERFREIDEGIRHVIEETVIAAKELVVFFEQVTGEMVRDIGGKNANLAEIKNTLKLNVPDAFAVTTRAFDAFMVHNQIYQKIQLPKAGTPISGASLHEAHELILHAEMPPDLHRAIDKSVSKIRSRCKATCTLAVRSSAGEEDGEFSFAGQFETVLNVPLETAAVEKAYRKVLASLFSETSAIYQEKLGYALKDMKMAVGCVVMVDAATSGVLYSADQQGSRDTLTINAAWGLGTSVVEGRIDADLYRVNKSGNRKIVETRIGAKGSMVVGSEQGGVITVETPEEKRTRSSLDPGQVAELARLALLIENHFRRPQDIEWAFDGQGRAFILQARPLRLPSDETRTDVADTSVPDAHVLVKNSGLAVQNGVAAGRVFILKNNNDLDSIPKGAILVARHDSSNFVRVMTDVAAIVTDTGTLTSHMAALCREFRIPTVVNAGNATRLLAHGQEITLQVVNEGATMYQGLVRQVMERVRNSSVQMDELSEFRKKRYLLRYIAPLNLVDPLRDEFTPEACRTLHDLLRFIHEKSVAELIETAQFGVKASAVTLDLTIPAGIMVIDIGGGLNKFLPGDHITAGQVASLPLRALIRGMTRPGIWRSDAVPLNVNDFMSSMLRMPDIMSDSKGRVESNMAVISREYANISLKFGYHFILVDCFCGENAHNNHIYFRFAGGATDMTKRSRRLQLIAEILGEYGFTIKTKGDLIVARLANISRDEAESVLDQLGRLISFTRQLDAVLQDDHAVQRYARNFLDGIYQT
ncbi:MAG: PEP-utilizing enzyme [Nitrospirae bacterium]|nr:PEP-utilizing enzyme [Nitrospirota bacterium]